MCLNIFVGILVVLFVIHNFHRYTTSVNCCWNYSIATITKLLNTQRLEPVTPQPHLFRKTDHIINLELPYGCGSLVTPMTLTHSVYPIRNRSKNKHRNLWIGYVSSWCSSGNSFHVWYTYIPSHCIAQWGTGLFVLLLILCTSCYINLIILLHHDTWWDGYAIVFLLLFTSQDGHSIWITD